MDYFFLIGIALMVACISCSTTEREHFNFTELNVNGLQHVHVFVDAERQQKVILDGDVNEVAKIDTVVADNVLQIRLKPDTTLTDPDTIKINVTINTLKKLTTAGTANVLMSAISSTDVKLVTMDSSKLSNLGIITADSLHVTCSGHSSLAITINAKVLNVEGHETAQVLLSGSADKGTLVMDRKTRFRIAQLSVPNRKEIENNDVRQVLVFGNAEKSNQRKVEERQTKSSTRVQHPH